MGEYCNLCNLIHFLSQTLAHPGESGIFLFTRALSPTSRFQRPLAHMAPRKPPPVGPARSPAGARRHRSAEGRLRQGCSGPRSPPTSLSPSLAFSKTVLATMFSSSIDELGQRRQAAALQQDVTPEVRSRRATTRLLPDPSALSPRAWSPPSCRLLRAPPGGGGAPRAVCSRGAAPRPATPSSAPPLRGRSKARALLPPSPGGVAPRSGPAAPRRRHPRCRLRGPGHAGTCSPGAAPPHLAPAPRSRSFSGERGRAPA